MPKRKTINIVDLKIFANDMLLHTPDDFEAERNGIAALVEKVLHETGNYNGFRYLNRRDMLHSMYGSLNSVGVNIDDEGETLKDYDARFENTDRTRVEYY